MQPRAYRSSPLQLETSPERREAGAPATVGAAVGFHMNASIKTMAAGALAIGLALAAASAVQAADGSVRPNYTFPSGIPGFALASHGGVINPGVLVGFNPQPEPPGKGLTVLDLSNPFAPTFFNPTGAPGYSLIFAITGLGDAMIPLPDAPNSDGRTGFRQLIGGHVLDVEMIFGPGPSDPASWVAFNPQPDPPGDWFGAKFLFGGQQDPIYTYQFKLDDKVLSFTLASVPEPAGWALMIAGFGLMGAMLRASRRRTAAA